MTTFTMVHVIISLIAIASGLVVLFGLLTGRRLNTWTGLFLTSTVAMSVSGFFFPFQRFTPGHAFSVISLMLMSVVIFGLYFRHLAGAWRWIYAVSCAVALYLNVSVLIVQAFLKVPVLKAIAPTQFVLPALIVQALALVLFVVLTILAVIKFRIEPARPPIHTA